MTLVIWQAATAAHRLWLDGQDTGLRVRVCASFRARLVGWGRGPDAVCRARQGSAVSAVWLEPCAAIHTLWSRSAIDVAFIGASGQVLRVCAAVRPGQMRLCRGARAVLELPSGALANWDIAAGANVVLVAAK
jgi:hypothetical protein